MKKFNITVNGQAYEVEVEEVGGAVSAAPAPKAAPAPAAAPAPKAAAAPAAAPAGKDPSTVKSGKSRILKLTNTPSARMP